jgi:uncharacterized membrane protein YbaN (DUF454 family)
MLARPLAVTIGLAALALGAVGLVLPLLPTTPFLLLAAAAFARSSPRLHDWLLSHRLFGPPIADWRDGGRIARRTKTLAVVAMVAAFAIAVAAGVGTVAMAIQAACLSGAAAFVLTRPGTGTDTRDDDLS